MEARADTVNEIDDQSQHSTFNFSYRTFKHIVLTHLLKPSLFSLSSLRECLLLKCVDSIWKAGLGFQLWFKKGYIKRY